MPPGTAKGFTLLELVVAFTVLALAATGLFYLASTTTTGNLKSLDQAAAMRLAIDKMEELKNGSFASLASGSDSGQINAGGAAGGVYTRSWTVAPRTIAGVAARDLTVSVSWVGGGPIVLTSTVVNVTEIAAGYPTVFVRSWDQRR